MKNSISDTANRFLGLVRFSHTLFALPFALSSAALVWARHGFSWIQLAGIVACLALALGFAGLARRRGAEQSLLQELRSGWPLVRTSGAGMVTATDAAYLRQISGEADD